MRKKSKNKSKCLWLSALSPLSQYVLDPPSPKTTWQGLHLLHIIDQILTPPQNAFSKESKLQIIVYCFYSRLLSVFS